LHTQKREREKKLETQEKKMKEIHLCKTIMRSPENMATAYQLQCYADNLTRCMDLASLCIHIDIQGVDQVRHGPQAWMSDAHADVGGGAAHGAEVAAALMVILSFGGEGAE
jgi:hypothetical protein